VLGVGLENEEDSALEFELRRPRLLATLLWGLGIATWALTVYGMLIWHGWMDNVDDGLLVLVSFVCGLNAVTIGFLIDMHSLEFKGVRIGLRRRRREKKEGK
jgi:CHASE2 domain-containing sensor protein